MVKSKNIIAGLGVVAGLGMALLPLGAFAATESENAGHIIRAKVGEIIELTFTDNTNYTGYNSTNTKPTGYDDYSLAAVEPGALNSKIEHGLKIDTNARGGFELQMSTTGGNALRLITAYKADNKTADAYSDSVMIDSVPAAGSDLDGDETTDFGWGYKIAEKTASYSGDYKQIPGTEYVTIQDSKRSAGNYHTDKYAEEYKVNFGIRPKTDQASGNYEAVVNYKAVANVLGNN